MERGVLKDQQMELEAFVHFQGNYWTKERARKHWWLRMAQPRISCVKSSNFRSVKSSNSHIAIRSQERGRKKNYRNGRIL